MMKYCWMLGLLLCALGSRAQSDSLQAEVLMASAQTCLSDGKIDSATYYHEQALKLFQKNNHFRRWLSSYVDLAYVWADDLKQPFTGTDFIQQGIDRMNKWRQPRNTSEWEQLVFVYNSAGYIRKSIAGDFIGARDFYEQAYHLFEEKLHEESDNTARHLYHNLGNLYTRLGDYPRAENMLRKGVAYGYAHPAVGMADQGDLAIVMMETHRYEEALKTVREGLDLKLSKPKVVVSMLQNEAIVLHKLGRTKEALQKIRKVPERISRLSMNEDSLYYSIENHTTEAEILMGQKEYALAEILYKKAIKEGESYEKYSRRREIAKAACALGNVHFLQHNYKEALADYHYALQSVIKPFTTKDPNQLPDPSLFISENTIMEALEGKAQVYLALGQLEKALQCHELIPVVAAKLIATHAYESSSLITLEEARLRFDKAIEIAWQLYQKTGQRSYAERAFALTEQARAVLLLQSIAKARRDFQLPPEIRRQEQDLDAKMAWLEQQIATEKELTGGKSDKHIEQLEQELFQVKRAQQKFQDQLRRDYADYANLSDQLDFMNVAGVAALLHNNQALIDYYLTDTDAYIFYFNTSGTFSVRKTALPPLFRDNVLRFFNFMTSNNENPEDKKWFLRMSYEMYVLLLQPELEKDQTKPQNLLIIPDDALSFIPFDVLLYQPATAETSWRDLKYLLDHLNTGYAYSATLWDMQQKISRDHRKQASPKYNFAGFAPTYGSNSPRGTTRSVQIPDSLIYDIQSTQDELTKVHALMGGNKYAGLAASEQVFKDIAPDCGILLLAMHGLANDEHPELSCLLFGRPRGDSINNNVLFANELQIMQLQADLAVLSACHTGFGKLHK
ncbi:MAG: tetratricopeptide repeat protein, partial [Saprospiraceae bacterium]|nr:tetratricopeptide repeat protein [Saprospiraceae bacterium]